MIDALNGFVQNLSSSADYTASLTTLLVLIFILMIYLIVFKLGVFVIGYVMDYKGDPYIFRGTLQFPKERNKHYFTNPMDKHEDEDSLRVILRSDNERNGIEFTWSVWLYLDARNMNKDVIRAKSNESSLYHMFNKGGHVAGKDALTTDRSDNIYQTGTVGSFQSDVIKNMAIMTCPGMYLKHSKVSKAYYEQAYRDYLKERMADDSDVFGFEPRNQFKDAMKTDVRDGDNDVNRNMYEYVFTINTMSPNLVMETISVPNIPLNLWTHVVFRCINHKVDVYVNGRIKKRTVLGGLPRQNYGDIYVGESYQDAASTTPACDLQKKCTDECEKKGDTCKEACGVIGDHHVETPEFHGQMSNLRYFNYALQARAIEYYTEKGPDLKPAERSSTMDADGKPYYLTQRWHYTDYLH